MRVTEKGTKTFSITYKVPGEGGVDSAGFLLVGRGALAISMAPIAMVWNYIYNIGFDQYFGHDRVNRSLFMCIGHGICFKAGMVISTLVLPSIFLTKGLRLSTMKEAVSTRSSCPTRQAMGRSKLRPVGRVSVVRTPMQALTALVLALFSISASSDCVILLNGLARTSSSMQPVASALMDRGYTVVNVDYPSREKAIEELAPLAVRRGLSKCPPEGAVHFVTHSLGGILVRYYLENNELASLGRVVMLAPPNHGSEAIDNVGDMPGVSELSGPAGAQLGTDENSAPLSLGPVDYEVGIIAGTESLNPILSQYLPNPDDGKVAVESTKVEGMRNFIEVPHSHPFIMRAPKVLEQILLFIESGRFDHDVP